MTSRVKYIVHIDVLSSLAEKYHAWLVAHVEQMKTPAGLGVVESAEIVTGGNSKLAEDAPNSATLKAGVEVARFDITYVTTKNALDNYLASDRVAAMRGDAVKHFADAFTGSRQIIDL